MVCAKCQKLSKGTSLATPGVKKKSELYHGSPAASSSKSATQGQTGIGKVCHHPSPRPLNSILFYSNVGRWIQEVKLTVRNLTQSKLLSKSAKNPYAQYSRYERLSSNLPAQLLNTGLTCRPAPVPNARPRSRRATVIATNAPTRVTVSDNPPCPFNTATPGG